MASFINSLMNALGIDTNDDDQLDLPMHEGQISDILMMEEQQPIQYDEKELAEQAFLMAKMDTFRENDKVYRCDFFKGLCRRVPATLQNGLKENDVLYRVEIEHPVVAAIALYGVGEPIHHIKDYYGDMFVYRNEVVQTGISVLIDVCTKHGYHVENDPAIEEHASIDMQEEEPGGEEEPEEGAKKEL